MADCGAAVTDKLMPDWAGPLFQEVGELEERVAELEAHEEPRPKPNPQPDPKPQPSWFRQHMQTIIGRWDYCVASALGAGFGGILMAWIDTLIKK